MQYSSTTPRYWVICICTCLHAFASLGGVFPPLLSLKYITYSFFPSLPACCRAPPRSPRREAIRTPLSSLPSCLPSLIPSAPAVCSAAACCRLSSLLLSLYPRRSSVCPVVCRAACPSLVRHEAQNAVTVWADAPRICPRPYLLLSMCCRVFRCLFRVCALLPAVVRRQ